MRLLLPAFAFLAALAVPSYGVSAPITDEGRELFESKIRPVLIAECYECHGPKKSKGGLRVDSRDAILQGGDSGPTLVPGHPDKSLLIQSLAHTHSDEALHMPKDGAKLDDATLKHFIEWIRMGAPDPRDEPEPVLSAEQSWEQTLAQRKKWWCFQPVKKPALPKLKDTNWSAHPLDKFILAKLEAEGLQPAKPADAATLFRRLNFVLTGLPPTTEELAAFVKAAIQPDPDQEKWRTRGLSTIAPGGINQTVYQEAVERLLDSPRFGEKWARHWMDWVRYAESYGSEGDPPIPYAWRYRDYLIRAFNSGVPYPQMVREAIAGDLLENPRLNKELGINESALGIGQLRMVLHGFSPTDGLDEMVTFTDNQIDTVTKAFQGLTVSCARCHNHKFDAISQADFYALYGIFTSTHPAVVDVNAPGAGKVERAELLKLKEHIKQAVGIAWLAAAEELTPTDPPAPASSQSPPNAARSWDLRKDKWFASGQGVAQGPTKAGEFAIATEGKAIIARLHPAGVFSDLVTTKDRAVLMSPTFKCEGGTLWMRSAGGGGSKAKYVVQNYPRTGTIHKAKEFKDEGDTALGWHKLDLNYWKGDDIFIQCATVSDMPAETKEDTRSWFGITDAMITVTDGVPPQVSIGGNAHEAVTAWLAGTMTDAQAELLDSLQRSGKLPNDTAAIPAIAPLLARYRELEERLPQPTRAPGVLEADARDAALFVRGDHKQPAQIVPRRFLDGIDPKPYHPTQSGRLELAESLTRPANPLTSRVIVNRLWHHIFGRGLVATPDNFGRLGEMPTHPELLDFMASEFSEWDGPIKAQIRFLVMSRTFQLSDEASVAATQKDPENKLLSHWSVRRLEAEAIRDSIVAVSGKLEPTLYGAPVNDDDPRRSIYLRVVRNSLDPFLTAFDMPVPFTARGRRDVTNVPAQSLALLNDPTIARWASHWARLVVKQNDNSSARVQRMFVQALGREASAEEVNASLAFVKASADAGEVQRDELAQIERQAGELQRRTDAILGPIRAKLTEQKPGTDSVANVPEPYAEWDFEKDASDRKGHLPLKLEGSARIEHGALVLDGNKSLARSEPLQKDLTKKTLEAWVLLDTPDQQGGGVITVQDLRGVVFDSIVFAENQPKEWLAGSDNHKRTRDFSGEPDVDAAKRPVHVAITYADGKVNGYRDGVRYGKGFKNDDEPRFKAGESQVLLGCRHGGGGGNKLLRGRILRARLYDRALTPQEIEASRKVEDTIVTERDVMDALTDEQRASVRQWQAELEKLRGQAEALSKRLERLAPEIAGWESLALSIINLKEFVYLR